MYVYLLLIYRSQKTCRLQKDAGVDTSLSGLSLTGMASGPVLGFSTQPRTVQKEKHDIQLHKHQKLTLSRINEALQVNLEGIFKIYTFE